MEKRYLLRFGIVSLCMLLAVAFGMPRRAAAVADSETGDYCMQTIFEGNGGSGTPGCTANDSAVSLVSTGSSGTTYCKPGENVTASLIMSVTSATPDRYDLGLYMALDGGSAITGTDCFHTFWQTGVDYHDSLIDGTDSNLTNIDGDTCLDLTGGGTVGKKEAENITFLCQDTDGDGHADLNGCVGWRQNVKGSCDDLSGTGPATKSKCSCGSFNTDIVVAEPALSVTKVTSNGTTSATVGTGANVAFTITATNTGNVPLDNVDLDSAEKTDCTTNGTLTGPTGTAAPDGPLAPGDSWTWTCTINNATENFANCVTAVSNYTYPGDDTPTEIDSSQACANITVGSMDLEKVANPTTYNTAGQTITYTYTLTNVSGTTISGPFSISDNMTTATCNQPGTLAASQTVTCTGTYTITQADIDNGSVTNTATGGAFIDAEPITTQEATATVTAVQSPALGITKTANPTTYHQVGDVIDYSYKVTNTGNTTLSTPFTVTDDTTGTPDCGTLPTTLAPGQSFNCTSTYTITQDDINSGSVTNQASATADEGTVISPTVSATVRYGTLAVPTMTDWGMILFVFLAGLASIFYLRRRKSRI